MTLQNTDHRYLIWPDFPAFLPQGREGFRRGFERCERAGGEYITSIEAIEMIDFPLGTALNDEAKNHLRARVTTMLVDQRRLGARSPMVTRNLVAEAMTKSPLPVHERSERLLRFLTLRSSTVGHYVFLYRDGVDGDVPRNSAGELIVQPFPTNPVMQEAMAWSESTTFEEVMYLVQYLTEKVWIGEQHPGSFNFQVTVDGHEKIADLQTNPSSSQAFVAMWINDETKEAFVEGFRPGIRDAGYQALRIDKKDDVVKIDDEIISEIRRSRFLVADFTQGNDGARGGVYFEAGYALGLGIPVIFACRRDMVDMLHFDTRQYAHILWDHSSDLRAAIRERESAPELDMDLRSFRIFPEDMQGRKQ